MEDSSYKKMIEGIIDRERWADVLGRFVQVLHINVFVVDAEGRLLVPPYRQGDQGMFGERFFSDSFRFDFSGQKENLVQRFEQHGVYLEIKDAFDFHAFAIPIKAQENTALAYMVVGPVILNKRQECADYLNIASQLSISSDGLVDAIHEIRVVSFVTIKAILDLLSEVVKDIVQVNLEKQKLYQKRFNQDVLPKEIAEAAQDLYATIRLDELLVTILDVALNLTGAECGSIMLLDEKKGDLTMRVSRGLDEQNARNARVKIGQGIAGLVAKENIPLVISGTEGDKRIKHLLKRPEIKQSAVIPLAAQNRVFGILNLHTQKEAGAIEVDEVNLQHLSKLISTAISNI
jgi:hypothetical protein